MSLKNSYNQVLLKEATVNFNFDGEKPKTYSLKDVYAKEVLKSAQGYAFNLHELLDEWISICGWDSKEAKKVIPERLFRCFNRYINVEDDKEMAKIVSAIKSIISQKKTLRNFEESLKPDNTDFFSFFKKILASNPEIEIFNKPEILNYIINSIKFLESGVAVGPGEVFITLFSEATNPSKGDLQISDGSEVELKAGAGRAGKKSADAAYKGMKHILKDLKYVNEDRKNIIKEKVLNQLNNMLPDLQNYVSYLSSLDRKNKIPGQHHIINRFNWAIDNINKANESFKKIDLNKTKWEDLEAKMQMSNIDFDLGIRDLLKQYTNIEEEAGANKNFNMYFDAMLENKNNEAYVRDAINTISMFSSETPDEKFYSIIYNTIKKSNLTGSNLAGNIIGMIQVADYYMTDGFKFIVFFDKTKGYKQLVLGPFTENYNRNLVMCLENIEKISVAAQTGGMGPAGSGGRAGFNIFVK